MTLEALQHACDQITHELKGWPGVHIERQQVFVRTDGISMLYIRAQTQRYYLHVEGGGRPMVCEADTECAQQTWAQGRNHWLG